MSTTFFAASHQARPRSGGTARPQMEAEGICAELCLAQTRMEPRDRSMPTERNPGRKLHCLEKTNKSKKRQTHLLFRVSHRLAGRRTDLRESLAASVACTARYAEPGLQ